MNVGERREKRARLLHAIYSATSGDPTKRVHTIPLGQEIGLTEEEVRSAVNYLVGEALLEYGGIAGPVLPARITHSGVVEVEHSLTSPDTSTEHLPPAINIINVETMTDSQIQQGNRSSHQSFAIIPESDLEAITSTLAQVRELLDQELLEEDAYQEASAQLSTIEAQLSSPRPQSKIISEAGRTLRSVIESAAGGAAVQGLLANWPSFLS